jgi:hypothetical protein
MNWTEVLKTLAPTVASAFLGPFGGMVVSAVGAAIGMDGATEDKIAKAFTEGQLKPEDIVKIKQLEMDFQTHEKELGFKYADLEVQKFNAEVKDRDSARQMQIATHSKMPAILTILVTVGFFGVLGLLFANPELKANEVMMIMVGQLSAIWGTCVAFYTGTTFNSAKKDVLLANSSPAK